jgi:hypothetical protein
MAGLHFPSAPHVVVNVALLSLAELSAKFCPAADDTCTTEPMKLSVEFKTCENDIGWQLIATKESSGTELGAAKWQKLINVYVANLEVHMDRLCAPSFVKPSTHAYLWVRHIRHRLITVVTVNTKLAVSEYYHRTAISQLNQTHKSEDSQIHRGQLLGSAIWSTIHVPLTLQEALTVNRFLENHNPRPQAYNRGLVQDL